MSSVSNIGRNIIIKVSLSLTLFLVIKFPKHQSLRDLRFSLYRTHAKYRKRDNKNTQCQYITTQHMEYATAAKRFQIPRKFPTPTDDDRPASGPRCLPATGRRVSLLLPRQSGGLVDFNLGLIVI